MNKYITQICPDCSGTGEREARLSWIAQEECWKCNGDGYLPNEEGLAILDLVYKFGPNNYRYTTSLLGKRT